VSATAEDLPAVRSAEALYTAWEEQHWSVGSLPFAEDAAAWSRLSPFWRDELLGAMRELHAGEVAVTETLTPLIDFAHTPADRNYLCTQIADEARHVAFFDTYFEAVGVAADVRAAADLPTYEDVFEPALRRATDAVREHPADPARWHAASVHYHLVTEAVLGVTVLRSTRQFARRVRVELPALERGLTNLARDESRHISFGLDSARRGVAEGHGEAILGAYTPAIRLAARVLVGPDRRSVAPGLPAALRARAAQVEGQWGVARDRVARNLGLIGLDHACDEVLAAWDEAREEALDDYEATFAEAHPVRRAHALGAGAAR
jgi:ribonucleoside-diphosphate reductase beta chain